MEARRIADVPDGAEVRLLRWSIVSASLVDHLDEPTYRITGKPYPGSTARYAWKLDEGKATDKITLHESIMCKLEGE